MRTLEVYVEYTPVSNRSALYVWDEFNYYTIKDGLIVATRIPDNCGERTPPFFEGSRDFITAIANSLRDQHNKGELLKTEGQSIRMVDEITWLREIVKLQIAK